MVNFRLSKQPSEIWLGGPRTVCHACNFPNKANKLGYLIVEGVKVLINDNYEVDLHLCLDDHAQKLKTVLDDVFPDDRLPKLQGELLSAHAARARAEKRADKAEAALHAMQDWITEAPAK